MSSLALARVRFPSVSAIQAELMTRRFSKFVQGAWHVIEPVTPLIWNWHMDAICDHVQALVELKLGCNNLIINVPPGTSKSTIVSVCLPAWLWIKNPSYRGVFASGNPRVTTRDSMKCRAILESRWYIETFDIKWRFTRDQNAKLSYKNTKTGERVATTSGMKITGERYQGLFVDDALDAQDAFSQVEVDKINQEWWDQGFYNRINDEKTGTRCILGQRLREDDLPGYIMARAREGTWLVLAIPQEWEEAQRRVTSLGWTDPRKEEGELMFPARFDREALDEAKIVLGQSGYEGQHQQRPSMLKGELFKRGHAQFIYPGLIPAAAIKQTAISWDTAVKTGETNDWSVSLVGVEFDKGVLIKEEIRIKTGYPGLKEATKLQMTRVKANALLIEDKQTAQALIQELRSTTSWPIVAINPTVDKVARAWPLVPYWEANRVFFPTDAHGVPEPWVELFLAELYSFPKAPHDDRVDSLTQLLTHLFVANNRANSLIEWANQQTKAAADGKEAARREEAKHHPVETIRLMGAR